MEIENIGLETFLSQKPMAYREIDLKRMPNAFEMVKDNFSIPEVIHLVGTNGKGTTGRFLAEILRKNGFSVGHYSSPHIVKINERFWVDGSDISDQLLDNAHSILLSLFPEEIVRELTYFEYTTLLSLPIFQNCQYLVLEAGLGGEFDATSVFPKRYSIVTPIGFDHQSFLGDSIEEIAGTKLRAMGGEVVISKQKFREVYPLAEKIAEERGGKIYRVFPPENLHFLEENLLSAKEMAKIVGAKNIDFSIEELSLPNGRVQKVGENIVVDVGHNLLSAERVLESLEWKKFVLIYNSFEDKPYREILELFKDRVERVEILELEDSRIVEKEELEKVLKTLEIEYCNFEKIEKGRDYLVFGSFRVVEEFLEIGNLL
jgi:dihydrofolate synthase/folylpolyglutamate synthase